jgi:hypothetical protein
MLLKKKEIEIFLDCGLNEIIMDIKEFIKEDWDEEFKKKSEDRGRHYFKIESVPRSNPWFVGYNSTNKEIKTLNRIRGSHFISNIKLKLYGKSFSEFCENCNEVEDLIHILLKCKNILGKILKTNNVSIVEIIKFEKAKYKEIYKFLKENNIEL